MNVGELFVSLGVKGSDKTIGALKETRQGLKDTASFALEARVALLGAFYAFERLMSASNQTGTSLTNFGALMDGGVQRLQRYQYIAKQVGSSNEEMAGTFKKLTATATDVLLGKGAPEVTARIAQIAGLRKGEMASLLNAANHGNVEPLFQMLNRYAQREDNVGLRSKAFSQFGISEAIGAGMIRNKFNAKDLAAAPTYSDKEVASLDKTNQAWSRLGTKIEMAIGHFNAKHGNELVNDISKITDKILKLADAFEKLASKTKLFDWIGKVFEGWTIIFDTLSKSIEQLSAVNPPDDSKKAGDQRNILNMAEPAKDSSAFEKFTMKLFAGMAPGGGGLFSALLPALDAIPKSAAKPSSYVNGVPQYNQGLRLVPPPPPSGADTVAPPVPASAGGGSTTQNINVSQNLNFNHDGKDAARTGKSIEKAVKDTFRSLGAQSQGN